MITKTQIYRAIGGGALAAVLLTFFVLVVYLFAVYRTP
jgi:hypothetical protein